MIYCLSVGALLGLSAGFAPGPLLTLVISETLKHDVKSGIKVAIAPIITDLPIIILTVFVLSKLSGFRNVLGIISMAGGFFILFLSWESLRTKGVSYHTSETAPKSLMKRLLANALSPHPYLFWFSVGAPMIVSSMAQGIGASLAFIAGFYIFLVGSKILLAVLTGKSKSFITGRVYVFTMRLLGTALAVLGFVLFYEGLNLLGIFNG